MTAHLEVDREQIEQFVATIFRHADEGNRISLRSFYDDGKDDDKPPFPFRKLILNGSGLAPLVSAAAAMAARAANAPRPVVFCPPLVTLNPRTGTAKAEDLMEGLALSVEIDKNPDNARTQLAHLLGFPTVTVESGGEWVDPDTGEIQPRAHAHWRLSEPARTVNDLAKLREARDLATSLAGGDATNIPLVHPIRWPGSWHRKAKPKMARIVEINADAEVDLDEALELLREAAGAMGVKARPHHSAGRAGGFRIDTGALLADCDADVAAALQVIPNEDADWSTWNTTGMAAYAATGGSDAGLAAFAAWSAKSAKHHNPETPAARWTAYHRSPPDRIGFGTLVYLAQQEIPGWEPPSRAKAGGEGEGEGEGGEEGGANAEPKGGSIKATPYIWTAPETIPTREWLYGRHLLRRFVSATIAPGGVGKTSLGITEMLAMISGRDLLGMTLPRVGRLRGWYLNLEDPRQEVTRQIQAAAFFYGLTPADNGDRLYVDSGREQSFVIAQMTRTGAVICRPVVESIVGELKAHRIDALTIIDPFVSSHAVPENDNGAQDLIVKEWGKVADAANCAVHLIHHTRKQLGEMEVNAESARGAKALTDGCRSVRAINRMTKDEAARAGIDNHRRYFRTYNDKANLAPPSDKSDWFRLESVSLGNGDGMRPSDEMGVITTWAWPDCFAGVSAKDAGRVRAAIGACPEPPRADVRSKDWAGKLVANELGLDLADKQNAARVKSMLATWIQNAVLATDTVHDARNGRDVAVIIPGPNDPERTE